MFCPQIAIYCKCSAGDWIQFNHLCRMRQFICHLSEFCKISYLSNSIGFVCLSESLAIYTKSYHLFTLCWIVHNIIFLCNAFRPNCNIHLNLMRLCIISYLNVIFSFQLFYLSVWSNQAIFAESKQCFFLSYIFHLFVFVRLSGSNWTIPAE